MRERVVSLEAQQPHINASLTRIEKMVERVNGHLVRLMWAVLTPIILGAVGFIIAGGMRLPV